MCASAAHSQLPHDGVGELPHGQWHDPQLAHDVVEAQVALAALRVVQLGMVGMVDRHDE